MGKYILTGENALVDAAAGTIYDHNFELDGKKWWTTKDGLTSGFTKGPDGQMVRLGVERGIIKRVRWAKPGEADRVTGIGDCVSPELSDIEREGARSARGSAVDVGNLAPKSGRLHFEGKVYVLDEASLRDGRTMLPDGRILGLVPNMTQPDGSAVPAAILQDDPVCRGIARLVSGSTALALPGETGVELTRPIRREELAELFSGPEALSDEAMEAAPIVNLPLMFACLGSEKKEHLDMLRAAYQAAGRPFPEMARGQTLLVHRCKGIPLQRVEIPAWMGAQDPNKAPRERHGYFVLTTAPDTVVSTRDEKRALVPPGSIVLVEEKADVRSMLRFLPKYAGPQMVRASDVVIDPQGKVPFQLKQKDQVGAIQVINAYTWRIHLRNPGSWTIPAALQKIQAMMNQIPIIPSRPDDELIEAAGEAID